MKTGCSEIIGMVTKLSLLDFRISRWWRWVGKVTPFRYFSLGFSRFLSKPQKL